MPELTEVTDTQPRNEEENDSGTDSDGDDGDSIPELEETGAEGGEGEGSGAAALLGEDGVSKNKQSRGEKKARKIMSKLGLKQVCYVTFRIIDSTLSSDKYLVYLFVNFSIDFKELAGCANIVHFIPLL